MPVSRVHRLCRTACCFITALTLFFSAVVPHLLAQTELATILGRVTDQSGAVVTGAEVEIRNVDTNLAVVSATNADGLYTIPSLHPGHYVISVRKPGFKSVSVTQLDLNVQDNVVRNFILQVGSSSESVTVTAESEKINTTDATVSTVVDRNFADNLPMNGRSFQTLIQLTPGVVVVPTNFQDAGQFSVSGQRASSNYWMVDGVSANIGTSALFAGNGMAGALPSFSVLGGTNSLVSVDALQEFRIQTSTYAPEFGRTPGAQISIVTRSGTNQFHGTAFEYFRNDILDANDWFADNKGQPKPEERQNDFGGTVSGPLLKNRTFFFFSYEGLRLRLPRVAETVVPDSAARQGAISALQPFFNAYPSPNGPEILDDQGNPSGAAEFNASFSNRATLNASSLRIDHRLNEKMNVFARYDYSPSDLLQRAFNGNTANTVSSARSLTQTTTAGWIWTLSPVLQNDLRFNFSKTTANSSSFLDNFGNSVPLTSLPYPSGVSGNNAAFEFGIFSLPGSFLTLGKLLEQDQKQINIIDNLAWQKGRHGLKFGVDFRRLASTHAPRDYAQGVFFLDVPSAQTGSVLVGLIEANKPTPLLFHNLGMFAQDTWRVMPRLTLTYGLRWDVDFAPSAAHGPDIAAVENFDDLSRLSLAPSATPPFHTTYGNFAPRMGAALQLSQRQGWNAVLRGGLGVFFDLATQEVGNTFQGSYPFGGLSEIFGVNFPLDAATAAPPPITPANLSNPDSGILAAFNPHLKLPYTLQWNVALEQALGNAQSLSMSYIGASGRRLIQTEFIFQPNPNFDSADLITNAGTSDYNALQLQFERRLTRRLQALASYTWAHSIDTASAGSLGSFSNALIPATGQSTNRGPSDFDIRNAVSAGITYELPRFTMNSVANAIIGGWSIQSVVQAHSAAPVDVFDSKFFELFSGRTNVRADVVPGQPFYLSGAQYPGGRALNIAAFTPPPVDPNTGVPLRQGNLGRNALRAFGATQWDFAVHRDFPLTDSVKLQFRAELFNVLNHPNFGPPATDIKKPGQFGRATEMLGSSLGGENLGGGGFSTLYQIGGPRSVQFALKLQF